MIPNAGFSGELPQVQNLLSFYEEHGISPVSQDISDLEKHFQRRESLYRLLGLLPAVFSSGDVLEIGPGSGHNSLWIASLHPKSYRLLEPNGTAVTEIKRLYDGLKTPHLRPEIITKRLEDFRPGQLFDVVICEGWLGGNPKEMALMKTLSSFVKPGGALVVTYVPPTGVFPNIVRRLIARRLDVGLKGLTAKTAVLKDAFASHLGTLTHMSRPAEDWIHDNMINPALLWQPLNPPMILSALGSAFQPYGGAPHFAREWRWYKSLVGEARDYRKAHAEDFYAQAHNFMDYRHEDITPRSVIANQDLEQACISVIGVLARIEEGEPLWDEALDLIAKVLDRLSGAVPLAEAGLAEALTLLRATHFSSEDVARMTRFNSLFGRENCYISVLRDRDISPRA